MPDQAQSLLIPRQDPYYSAVRAFQKLFSSDRMPGELTLLEASFWPEFGEIGLITPHDVIVRMQVEADLPGHSLRLGVFDSSEDTPADTAGVARRLGCGVSDAQALLDRAEAAVRAGMNAYVVATTRNETHRHLEARRMSSGPSVLPTIVGRASLDRGRPDAPRL